MSSSHTWRCLFLTRNSVASLTIPLPVSHAGQVHKKCSIDSLVLCAWHFLQSCRSVLIILHACAVTRLWPVYNLYDYSYSPFNRVLVGFLYSLIYRFKQDFWYFYPVRTFHRVLTFLLMLHIQTIQMKVTWK